MAVSASVHEHAAEAEVVLCRSVQRHTGTCEEVVATLFAVAIVCLVVRIAGLLALHVSGIGTMAVAEVYIRVNQSAVVVDVEACVGTAASVATCLHRAVIASLAVFLEHNVDDTSRTFSREFSRRIVYDLYTFNALCRQLLQNLCTVIGSQSRCLAVDPYLHA